MKLDEKNHFIHQVAAMLQNNHGNRLTCEITNGVLSQLDAAIQVDPDPPKAAGTLAELPQAPAVAGGKARPKTLGKAAGMSQV